MIPDGLVVCPRYRMVVATLPLRPAAAPAPQTAPSERGVPARVRTPAGTAEILVTTALGVVASMAIVLGLVWAAFAVSVT